MSLQRDLITTGSISEESVEIYSVGTRDNPDIEVYRDPQTGVIFIPSNPVDDRVYREGAYRAGDVDIEYENIADTQRRVSQMRCFYQNKTVLDFGCGLGSFLEAVAPHARAAYGVELQDSLRNNLTSRGLSCVESIEDLEDNYFDTIFLFHVFEHLNEPVEFLERAKAKLKSGGRLILEVPSANDFLLAYSRENSFKNFTLWSQHLVLHTWESITKTLRWCGFDDVLVKYIQRYPLSNHLGWLRDGEPGGHVSGYAFLNDEELNKAYENVLAAYGLTDTLLAYARKP